jgi:predicted dehydrogenase
MRHWYGRVPGLTVVGGFDTRPARAHEFAARWRVPVTTNLAAIGRADVVMIATPPGTHLEAVKRCIEARGGSPTVILIQKPVAATLRDLAALSQLQSATTQLRVCHDRRWSAIRWLEREIRTGRIGLPRFATCRFDVVGATASLPRWCFDREMSGGGVTPDLLPHPFDLAWVALGRPEIVGVSATTTRRVLAAESPVEDTVSGVADFVDDSRNPGEIRFAASWEADKPDLSVAIEGTRGRADWWAVDRPGDVDYYARICDVEGRVIAGPDLADAPPLSDCRATQVAEAARLLRAMQRGDQPEDRLPTLPEAAVTVKVTDAVYRSAAGGGDRVTDL